MTCRAADDGYRLHDEHYDGCDEPTCAGCLPCVPADDLGRPLDHCTARKRCVEHIPPGTLSCHECVGKVRWRLGRIGELHPLVHVAAVEAGRLDSEALNLAGPTPEVGTWVTDNAAVVCATGDPGTDEPSAPYLVLGRWQLLLEDDPRGCYPVDSEPISVAGAVTYLDAQLARLAQDPEHDFPLFVRDVSACLGHVETVMATARRPETGAPCPACIDAGAEKAPRLVMERGTREELDRWVCPSNRMHAWSDADYRLRVDAGYATVASALTASQFAEHYQIKEGSVRGWAAKVAEDGKPLVRKRGKDHRGLMLYDKADVMDVRAGKRKAKGDTADTMPQSA